MLNFPNNSLDIQYWHVDMHGTHRVYDNDNHCSALSIISQNFKSLFASSAAFLLLHWSMSQLQKDPVSKTPHDVDWQHFDALVILNHQFQSLIHALCSSCVWVHMQGQNATLHLYAGPQDNSSQVGPCSKAANDEPDQVVETTFERLMEWVLMCSNVCCKPGDESMMTFAGIQAFGGPSAKT